MKLEEDINTHIWPWILIFKERIWLKALFDFQFQKRQGENCGKPGVWRGGYEIPGEDGMDAAKNNYKQ